jgi:nucleoside-diphosphate-sugar epimerase
MLNHPRNLANIKGVAYIADIADLIQQLAERFMHTILGAGGVMGNELANELHRSGERIRFVSRNPTMTGGPAEVVAADLSDLQQTIVAVSGSSVAYLMVGLKYDLAVWQDLWPRIMRNTIEACKKAKAKLIFLDNVYMYGKVTGLMTENTPFNPCSKKGEIRARIATMLLDEMHSGNLTALIARSADFYGPAAKNNLPRILIFDKFAKKQSASWLVNDTVRHSFTFTPDGGKGLALLAGTEKSWNQTWHLPTAPDPPTGREFIAMAAREFGLDAKHSTLKPWMIRLAGLFDPTVRESFEMLYQNDSEYLFDSTKFNSTFDFKPTPYAEGIRQAAAACTAG